MPVPMPGECWDAECWECRGPLRAGEPVRWVIEEHDHSTYELPVHADCRAALVAETQRLIGWLLVELMRVRSGGKDFGTVVKGVAFPPGAAQPTTLPAGAPEEPALFSEAS